jgi:hypothetical protein
MKIMIDPQDGWRYDFPKEYDPDRDGTDFFAWLLKEGYPQHMIDYTMKIYNGEFKYRSWISEQD